MAVASMYALTTVFNIECILLGVNCVLYPFCFYTLWGQKFFYYRLLLLLNTVQFVLCVPQVIFHTVFLFVMITVLPGDIEHYLSHVDPYVVGCTIIFGIIYIISGFLSIARLFVLYDNEVRVCIPAFVVWIAQICATAVVLHDTVTTPVTSTHFSPVNLLLWVLIATLNLYVAILICFRLCVAKKRTCTILSPSPFKFISNVLVECGALITTCSLVMMIIYASDYSDALVGLGTVSQIAVVSQLLTTARRGMLIQAHGSFSPTSAAHHEANVILTESVSGRASSSESVKDKTVLFAEQNSQDKKDWQTLDAMYEVGSAVGPIVSKVVMFCGMLGTLLQGLGFADAARNSPDAIKVLAPVLILEQRVGNRGGGKDPTQTKFNLLIDGVQAS